MSRRWVYCLLLLVPFLASTSWAQVQKAQTEEGREVHLHEDGTWDYASEEYERTYLGNIESGYIHDYPEKRIGEAFGGLFKLPEWRFEQEPNSDKKTVVFTGRLRTSHTVKTMRGVSRVFAENAPVKIEFAVTGPGSFDVNYAEIGAKSDDRWVPKEVRVDELLKKIYGKS